MIRGYNPFTFFKISGPILLCIIAIVSTKLAELYLSPGCSYYDPIKNIANVYVPSAVPLPSSWNLSYTPVTTTDFLGHLRTCVCPAPRFAAAALLTSRPLAGTRRRQTRRAACRCRRRSPPPPTCPTR